MSKFKSILFEDKEGHCGLFVHIGDQEVGYIERYEARAILRELQEAIAKWDRSEVKKETQVVRLPSNKLTVIIRDDSPMINCNDSPSFRSVQVELTPEQRAKMALHQTFGQGKNLFFEEISKTFIEPE